MRKNSAHRLEKQVEISASIGGVGNLTDAKLANWFPLEARVTPGEEDLRVVGSDCEGRQKVSAGTGGFFTGADWENKWFDSTSYGWGFILVVCRCSSRDIARREKW
jgi:hypothetical protein